MSLYLVKHASKIDGLGEDILETKIIGIFSSESQSHAAIELLRGKPGFLDFPNDFSVESYEIDVIEWDQGFISGVT